MENFKLSTLLNLYYLIFINDKCVFEHVLYAMSEYNSCRYLIELK